jgi:hypothetical protein
MKRPTLADRNNNPGNLRFAGQRGAVLGDKGFARFNTPQDGFNALKRQILLDSKRGLVAGQFIHKYAPPNENNTIGYTRFFCHQLRCTPDTPLKVVVAQNGITRVGHVISMQEDREYFNRVVQYLL